MLLNYYRDKAYDIAFDKGFHSAFYDERHFICLIISELMEAVEADRKNIRAKLERFEAKMEPMCSFESCFETYIKDTLEDELADACIRIFDLAGEKQIDLDSEFDKIEVYEICDYFTRDIFEICKTLTNTDDLKFCLQKALKQIFEVAKNMGIKDIEVYINHKMNYNESRDYLHNKRY